MPLIPLVEVLGNRGTVPPAQIVAEAPKLKVGVEMGLTVTLKIAVGAHSPDAGVNV